MEFMGGFMRHIACSIFTASIVLLQGLDFAQAENPRVPPGARQADRHNPFSKGYVDFQPNGLARRNESYSGSGQRSSSSRGIVIVPRYYRPYYLIGGGFYPPYYGSGYGSGYYGSPYEYPQRSNTFNTTNINININAPGLDATGNPLVGFNNGVQGGNRQPQANGRSLELGRKFVGYGDKQFSKGNYLDAQLRYRKAIKAAPDFAEAYFRRGQAMIALGQYDLAAGAFKQGLQLKPTWPMEGFRLVDLYGDNLLAMDDHLDALRDAVDQQPLNPDLEFLLAWQLYFGGQRHASEEHFVRAAAMDPDVRHIDGFLATLGPDEQADLPAVKEALEIEVEVDGPDALDLPDEPVPATRQPMAPFRRGVEF